MIVIALLALLFAGSAIGLLVWAVALPRMRAASRLRQIQAYGFSGGPVIGEAGEQSLSTSFGALAARLGDLISRWSGGLKEDVLRKELMAAGMYSTSPRVIAGYRVLAALAGVFLGASYGVLPSLAGRTLTAVLFAYVGWVTPLVLVRRRARLRLEEIDRRLPDLIDLMVVTVEAGVGFSGSLQIASSRIDGPLGDELRLTLQEQRMGRGLAQSLQNMLERADVPAMRSFVRAVTQGESLGVSIGTIMRNLALDMRKRRRSNAEERAQKAPVKILFPLIFLIFPALGIVLLGPAVFEMADAFRNL
jgi:tight adherence protein C